MLKNISIKEVYKKWCDCHTCLKMPVITAMIVCVSIYTME